MNTRENGNDVMTSTPEFSKDDPVLILIPTQAEMSYLLNPMVGGLVLAAGCATGCGKKKIAIGGWGLAAAGAVSATWMARAMNEWETKTLHVILVGLAGTYDEDRAPVGSAVVGTAAACWGIGAGEGDNFTPAEALGWSQGDAFGADHEFGDRMELTVTDGLKRMDVRKGELLSVTAAANDAREAARRAERHPDALAEDMETYAVAVAARRNRAQLTVIRGICNRVGDRDHARWRMEEAMASVKEILMRLVEI
jgi:futalosine hydrolase